MAKHLSSASNRIQGTLHNHGLSFNGNSFQGSHLHFSVDGLNLESNCRKALFQTNPLDDRSEVATGKPKLVHKACEWILDQVALRMWADETSGPQLLWIHGGSGMGKTMMSLFLLEKFETNDALRGGPDGVLLFYFVDSRNERRNTAVSLLRGLLYTLLQHRPALMSHLLPDFEVQQEALFAQGSLEALWRIFTTMLRDPSTGTVRCLIDGLDECQEDDLLRLLRKITTFFEQEQQHGAAPAKLKLILASRETPACIADSLCNYPRIDISAATAHRCATRVTFGEGQQMLSAPGVRDDPRFADLAKLALASVIGEASQEVDEARLGQIGGGTQLQPQPKPQHVAGGLAVGHPGPIVPPNADRLNVASYHHVADEYIFDPPVDSESDAESEGGGGEDLFADPPQIEQIQTDMQLVDVVQSEVQAAAKTNVQVNGQIEGSADLPASGQVGAKVQMDRGSLEGYIDAMVSQLAQDLGYDEFVSALVGAGLRSCGDGTFLWVSLAVEELRRHPIQQVEDVVDQLLPGLGALHCAASQGKAAVAKFLLQHGMEVDATTPRGWVALHFAAANGSLKTIQTLVVGGANIEARSCKGETPLHVAALRESTAAVEALLALGARVDAVDQEGKTPLAALRDSTFQSDDHKKVARILERAEAATSQSEALSGPSVGYKPPPQGRLSAGAWPIAKKRRSFLSLSRMVDKAKRINLR